MWEQITLHVQVGVDGAVHNICHLLKRKTVKCCSSLRDLVSEAESEVLQIDPQALSSAFSIYITGNIL